MKRALMILMASALSACGQRNGATNFPAQRIIRGIDPTGGAYKNVSDWKPIPPNGVINASGRYRLERDMRTDRTTGIEIKAHNVTVDLARHFLRYSGTAKEGTYGIAVNNRTCVTITNGTIGGFWFNTHCTQNQQLRIENMRFDDIAYVGVNVIDSKDVVLRNNSFSNFRYDVSKSKESAYVVGIVMGAEDATISGNRFFAQPKARPAENVDVETVFVLLSADVSRNCVVAQNEMAASEVLPRSYGVWVATKGQATIRSNTIRNMNYAVCLSDEASARVCCNRFSAGGAVGTNVAIETFGISAVAAKDVFEIENTFEGVSTPSLLPRNLY